MKKILFLFTSILSLSQYKINNAMEEPSLYCNEVLEPEKSLYCDEIIDFLNANTFSPGKKKIPNPALSYQLRKNENQIHIGKRKFDQFNAENSDITNAQAPLNLGKSEETDEIEAANLLLRLNRSFKKDEAREFFEKIKLSNRPSDATNGTLAREMLKILQQHPSLDVNNFKLEIVIDTNKKREQLKLIDLSVKLRAAKLYNYLISHRNAQPTEKTENLIKRIPHSRIAKIAGVHSIQKQSKGKNCEAIQKKSLHAFSIERIIND